MSIDFSEYVTCLDQDDHEHRRLEDHAAIRRRRRLAGRPCALCNTGRANPQLVFLRASSLDDPDIVVPRAQVFTKDAAKWEPLDPALPSFPEMPPERARKAMAGRD